MTEGSRRNSQVLLQARHNGSQTVKTKKIDQTQNESVGYARHVVAFTTAVTWPENESQRRRTHNDKIGKGCQSGDNACVNYPEHHSIQSCVRSTGHGSMSRVWETGRINILLKTCAARMQEKAHGKTYDEICCGSKRKPNEHKPCKPVHKVADSGSSIPVDNMHVVGHERNKCMF